MGSAPTDAEPAVILVKAYDHVLWSVQKAEKFPRSFRFCVGERIVQASLDLLLTLVDAAYSRDRAALLAQANRQVQRPPVSFPACEGPPPRLEGGVGVLGGEDRRDRQDDGRLAEGRAEGLKGSPLEATGNLWPQLTSAANLFGAAGAAAAGKRTRPDAAAFRDRVVHHALTRVL